MLCRQREQSCMQHTPLLCCEVCRTLPDCRKEVPQQSDMLPSCQAEVLEQEERLQAVFQPLPMHYIETAHLLLTHAKDTFSDGEDDTLTKVGLTLCIARCAQGSALCPIVAVGDCCPQELCTGLSRLGRGQHQLGGSSCMAGESLGVTKVCSAVYKTRVCPGAPGGYSLLTWHRVFVWSGAGGNGVYHSTLGGVLCRSSSTC